MSAPHLMTRFAGSLSSSDPTGRSVPPAVAGGGASGAPALQRRIAATRAGAAVLWAILYAIALHGRHVLSGADIPVSVGVLIAIYPAIDAVASVAERRSAGDARPEVEAGLAIDLLAIAGLLIAALALHTRWVVTGFGAWALVAGVLQVAGAWRAGRPRRAQLPLLLSGAISAVVGVTFVTMASQHVAHLSNLVGYPVLGAVFFLIWAGIDRQRRAAAHRAP
jgi:uncharacterized membrane protein HdeD (DUF308 family)